MKAALVRIALRYLAAALVARGLIGSDDASMLTGDPDVQMMIETGIGLAIAGGTELWHWIEAKFGQLYRGAK